MRAEVSAPRAMRLLSLVSPDAVLLLEWGLRTVAAGHAAIPTTTSDFGRESHAPSRRAARSVNRQDLERRVPRGDRLYDALGTGLRLMPIAGVVLGEPIGSFLTNRHGPRRVIPSGLLVASLGLLCLAGVGTNDTTRVLISLAVLSVGLGLTLAPAGDTILVATPARYAGAGSALTDTTIELGGALGIAVLGSIATSGHRTQCPARSQRPPRSIARRHPQLHHRSHPRAQPGPRGRPTPRPRAGRLHHRPRPRIYAALTLLVTTSTLRLLLAGKAGRGADIPDACSLLPDRPIPEPTHL